MSVTARPASSHAMSLSPSCAPRWRGHIARAEAGDGVVLCSGLGDTDTEAALYRYALVDRSPAALAAVHAAAERRIADILHG